MNSGRIDWSKKGIGWIPDLPAPIKVDENRELQQDGLRSEYPPLEDESHQLLESSLSMIQFRRVLKIDRVNKSILTSSSKDIILFKAALIIYYDKESEAVRKEFLDAAGLKTIKPDLNFHKWLNNDVFDQTLEDVVRCFQRHNKDKLVEDGIVGSLTYQVLENRLASIEQDISETNLRPIPSMIPNKILKLCFDYLKLVWVQSKFVGLASECLIEEESKKKIIEYFREHYQQIKNCLSNSTSKDVEDEIRRFEAYIERNFSPPHPDSDPVRSFKDSFIADLKKEFETGFIGHIKYETFEKLFRKKFHVVEPLVASFYQVASPLAGYTNPRHAIDSSFNKLSNYLNPNFVQDAITYKPFSEIFQMFSGLDISSNSKDIEKERILAKELGNVVLSKICRAEKEINTLASRDLSEDEKDDTLLLFKFIKEIYEPLLPFSEVEGRNQGNKYNSNLYKKQEVFSIDGLGDLITRINSTEANDISPPKTSEGKTRSSIFPTTSIRLPIDAQHLYHVLKLKSSKNYHFFLPSAVDLTPWCSSVWDQGSLNTCSALSVIALIEYWYQRNFNKRENLSALFLYKTARDLMHRSGDTGASIQATIQATVLFGVPPVNFWPYQEKLFDETPPSFCYSYAQSYKTIQWFHLDAEVASSDKELLLFKIRATLSLGIPCLFGLTLYGSVYDESNTSKGYIPYPSGTDQIVGGHTLVAIGYNDYKEVPQANGDFSSPGALLIRNSWGIDWGKQGYGWLPYEYVLKGLTADWWSLINAEWFDRQSLGQGTRQPEKYGQRIPPYGGG